MAASIAGPLAAKQGDLDGKRAAPEPFETVMKMIRPPVLADSPKIRTVPWTQKSRCRREGSGK